MARGLTLLFGGLIFVFVDFRVGRFEIAPDFIGYVLVAFAAHSLWQYTETFRKARNLAIAVTPFSLLSFGWPPPLPQVLLVPEGVLSLILMWILFGALIRFAEERERPVIADHTRICRRFYVGLAVFSLFLDQAARYEPERTGEYLHFTAMVSLVLLAFVLRVLYTLKQEFAPGSPVTSH